MTITDEQIKAVAGVRCEIPLHLKTGKTINIDLDMRRLFTLIIKEIR